MDGQNQLATLNSELIIIFLININASAICKRNGMKIPIDKALILKP